jgi:hypothetical protein
MVATGIYRCCPERVDAAVDACDSHMAFPRAVPRSPISQGLFCRSKPHILLFSYVSLHSLDDAVNRYLPTWRRPVRRWLYAVIDRKHRHMASDGGLVYGTWIPGRGSTERLRPGEPQKSRIFPCLSCRSCWPHFGKCQCGCQESDGPATATISNTPGGPECNTLKRYFLPPSLD